VSDRLKGVPLYFSDSPNLDGLGRVRMSESRSIFDMTFQYTIAPNDWNYTAAGAATVTHAAPRPDVKLSTTAANGDSAIFQTYRYFHYQPGKCQLVTLSGNFGTGLKTGSRRRWGQFDANNGLFFEFDGATLNAVVRSNVTGTPVENRVAQASWNLDKLDGNGPSGITLDVTKQQIWFIEYTWFSIGAAAFGVRIGRKTIYVHVFEHGNSIATPYSQTATLPIRIENTNTAATSGASDLFLTCASIISEGDYNPEGELRSVDTGIASKTLTTTGVRVPLISLRKTSTKIRVPVVLATISPFIQTADDILFEIIKNPTLTGAVWAGPISSVEYDLTATALTGGTKIHSFYMSAQANGISSADVNVDVFRSLDAWLGADIAGTSNILTLSATSLTAGAQVLATATWKEFE